MAISDDDIIAELTSDGPRLEDHFLIGDEICAVNRSGELTSLIVEDVPGEKPGERYYAILDLLRRHGVREYRSDADYQQRTQG